MTTATTNQKSQHLTFISEMAAHGQQRKAYMAAYPGCSPETADRGAHRLMEKPEIRAAIEAEREQVHIARQQLLQANITELLQDVQDKRDIVRQIYKGELQHTVYDKNNAVLRRTENTGQRMSAIRLDDKLIKQHVTLLQELAAVPALATALHSVQYGAAVTRECVVPTPVETSMSPGGDNLHQDYDAPKNTGEVRIDGLSDDQLLALYDELFPATEASPAPAAHLSRRQRRELERKQKKASKTGQNRTSAENTSHCAEVC